MDDRLRKWSTKLKRDFPLRGPVEIRTVQHLICKERGRLFGTADLLGTTFRITIERHPDISVQIDTLWHEWTHCLLWPRCRMRHSKAFWTQYGRIYSFYQD